MPVSCIRIFNCRVFRCLRNFWLPRQKFGSNLTSVPNRHVPGGIVCSFYQFRSRYWYLHAYISFWSCQPVVSWRLSGESGLPSRLGFSSATAFRMRAPWARQHAAYFMMDEVEIVTIRYPLCSRYLKHPGSLPWRPVTFPAPKNTLSRGLELPFFRYWY